MKGQEILDVQKILESRSAIVKDFNKFLGSGIKSAFTGSALIDWLVNNYNPTHTNREGLVQLVKEELFSPALPLQVIHAVEQGEDFLDSQKNLYRFLPDQFKEDKKDPNALNLFGIDTTGLQLFYENKESLSIYSVLDELQPLTEELYNTFLNETKTLVDYIGIEESELFNSRLLPVLTKLAFVDISPLLQDANQCKAFFINIYNIMNIHALIARYRKEKKLELHLIQRPLFYAQYKYIIGGQIYTLSDIEQGILRKNSALANDITSTVFEFAFKAKPKGERFSVHDPRRKFVLQHLDPRIHFALNPGTVSGPEYKYYTPSQIDLQLELNAREFCQINSFLKDEKNKTFFCLNEMFKFYKTDFANDDDALVNYILSYYGDEGRANIQSVLEQKEVKLKFVDYNWSLNNRFNS